MSNKPRKQLKIGDQKMRCVCRTWLNLLLDPQFAKLHFDRAPLCTLLRPIFHEPFSQNLYLIELKGNPAFDIGGRRIAREVSDCTCGDDVCHTNCDVHFKMKLNTIFRVPKLESEVQHSSEEFEIVDTELNMVNSCNGLLCLGEPHDGDSAVIYNPITGEYIRLPNAGADDFSTGYVVWGFGFSSKSNQYKVLKMVLRWIEYDTFIWGAKVVTVGRGGWRNIGPTPVTWDYQSSSVFLNGSLHWLCDYFVQPTFEIKPPAFVLYFDIDSEQFGVFAPPPPYLSKLCEKSVSDLSMRELEGCLCICDASNYDSVDIWVMKEYGVQESWTNVSSVETCWVDRCPMALRQPIDNLNNGNGNLLIYNDKNALVSYDGLGFRYLKIHGIETQFEVVTHTPSFLSLMDAAVGDNLEVLKVKSRSLELGPQGFEALFLVEEDGETDPTFSDSVYSTDTSEEQDDPENAEDQDDSVNAKT
ncbi:F-box protein At3g07870-like isoform X2 [Malania oleifera]|uniref:F-box protein At3g07870-like isoform X2 n=1 Tax=Malania oleifera TaxID=397392 RepID=UPI0025AE9092|nr:F-box protein At3g07870-like isoform X2 [Malania oleifera]